MKFIRDILTTADGSTWDEGRVLLLVGCAVMAAGGIMAVFKGSLDFIAFGTGFGGLLTGGGALLILKHPTEPQKTTVTTTEDDAGSSATIEKGAP